MKHAPLFLALTLLAPPVLAESLDAAWAAALAANPALQASEANTQASRHLVNSAKANRWPTLSAGAVWARHQPMPKVQTDLTGLTSGLAGLLPPMALARLPGSVAQPVADDKGWSANATVSLPVFTSGKITAGIRAAEAGVEAAEASETRARQDLKLAVAEAYLNVLRAGEALKVANQLVEALAAHQRDVGQFFQQGLVARSDVLAVEVALADARQKHIQARHAVSLGRSAYNRLLARPLSTPVSLDEVNYPRQAEPLAALQDNAARLRPELEELTAQAQALHAQARAIRAEDGPQVALFAAHTYVQNSYLTREHVNSAGVMLRWNVLDAGIHRERAAAVAVKADALRVQRNDLASQVALQVEQAWSLQDEAAERREVARAALALADEHLKIQLDRYANGLAIQTEVLDAQTRRADAARNLFNARYDHALAVLRLKRATGEL